MRKFSSSSSTRFYDTPSTRRNSTFQCKMVQRHNSGLLHKNIHASFSDFSEHSGIGNTPLAMHYAKYHDIFEHKLVSLVPFSFYIIRTSSNIYVCYKLRGPDQGHRGPAITRETLQSSVIHNHISKLKYGLFSILTSSLFFGMNLYWVFFLKI